MDNNDAVIEVLKDIAGELYNGNTNAGISQMGNVLGDLLNYTEQMADDEREEFVTEVLKPLLDAMERKDAIEMADIITYELIEKINK
ncbi:MAG: hypothetical protein IJ054_03565 [Lachnospiraceae bacterium]|nr:hypothetical protein [Lachnospiraceae bacterium]MBQ9234167.1 hypothetical protein [Lachnospiraceae bacterium]